MEGALNVWIVILAVGALNYLSRLSFIALFARRSMPAGWPGRCGSCPRRCSRRWSCP